MASTNFLTDLQLLDCQLKCNPSSYVDVVKSLPFGLLHCARCAPSPDQCLFANHHLTGYLGCVDCSSALSKVADTVTSTSRSWRSFVKYGALPNARWFFLSCLVLAKPVQDKRPLGLALAILIVEADFCPFHDPHSIPQCHIAQACLQGCAFAASADAPANVAKKLRQSIDENHAGAGTILTRASHHPLPHTPGKIGH